MKLFLKKISVYVVFVILLHIITLFLINGRSGDTYFKLIGPKSNSLIIGSSRASQGINPEIIKQHIKSSISKPIFNFAFNITYSPYGEVYYKAIKRKLDTTRENGIFILEVNPWSLSGDINCPQDDNCFIEKEHVLNKIENVATNPNFEYLYKCYKYGLGKLLISQINSNLMVHKSGWLEVKIPYNSYEVEKRLKESINRFSKKAGAYIESQNRILYLIKTIHLLKKYGKVVLVRLPIHEKLKEIEDLVSPSFEDKMLKIASSNEILYFSYINDNKKYQFFDGSHLYYKSSNMISKRISIDINKDLKQ